MSSLPLAMAAPPEHRPGDELGRSYTPDHVATAIVERLVDDGCSFARVVEPCVGGGAFVRAIKRFKAGTASEITGVDLDPGAPGLDLCQRPMVGDAAGEALAFRRFDLAITNPPFGPDVGQAVTLAIVRNARHVAEQTVMLLPGDYLTQVGWADLVAECAEVWPIVGRVWSHTRGMVVLVWDERHQGPTLFRPLRVRP